MKMVISTVPILSVRVLLDVKQKYVMMRSIMTVMVIPIVMIQIVLESGVVPRIVQMESIMMRMGMLTAMIPIV